MGIHPQSNEGSLGIMAIPVSLMGSFLVGFFVLWFRPNIVTAVLAVVFGLQLGLIVIIPLLLRRRREVTSSKLERQQYVVL